MKVNCSLRLGRGLDVGVPASSASDGSLHLIKALAQAHRAPASASKRHFFSRPSLSCELNFQSVLIEATCFLFVVVVAC